MLREKRRIAFFGGTFDPFHLGHLEMARSAAEGLRLSRVYFVPASQNPLKMEVPGASQGDRLEMIRLGISGQGGFGIWEGELSREGPSYTLESVQHIERVYPNCHLFWIIGSDQLSSLRNWRGIETLVHKIGFILVMRPGFDLVWPRIPGLKIYPVENPLLPVSSTELRARVQAGLPLAGHVPENVATYIADHALYK